MIKEHVAALEITSFAGVIGGEHFYGTLWFSESYKSVPVSHTMTTGLASRLNKKDGCRVYKAGECTPRFETIESVIKAGISEALSRDSGLLYILLGHLSVTDPQEMIWCIDDALMKKANDLYKQFDSLYEYTNDPWETYGDSLVDGLTKQWENLLLSIE